MIDKPEKKTPKPTPKKTPKGSPRLEGRTPVIREEKKPTSTKEKPVEKAESEQPVAEHIEEVAEPVTPQTIEEQLLAIYNDAPPGPLSLADTMKKLGVDQPILIKQAWDRLYDQRKVPFTKLYKPAKGHVGFEP